MSLCQRPGASSALVSLHELPVCGTTGQPASDKILPPFLHTNPPKPSYLYVVGVCVREARPPYCNRSLRVWLTHTHRGMLLARRQTHRCGKRCQQAAGGTGKWVCLCACCSTISPSHRHCASNACNRNCSALKSALFVCLAGYPVEVFGEFVDGLRFSFDGRHQVVPLAQPRASFRARDGGCGEIAHPLSPSHPKRTCVVQEQDMHANPDP
jgi:hypothetical protein